MANNSLLVRDKLLPSDIDCLRRVGARVEVYFDVSHRLNQKPPHFDLNVTISAAQVERLATPQSAQTYFKFWFSTQVVSFDQYAKRLKYEAFSFADDMIRRSPQRRRIEEALANLVQGQVGGMIPNAY